MTRPEEAADTGGVAPKVILEQANAAYDAGDYTRALGLFDEAIASGADNEVVRNNRGAALDALGMYGPASESYLEATRRAPGYELAWHNLGNCLLAQGLYEEASDAYRRATKLYPSRLRNLVGLANAHTKLGRTRRARATIRKLLVAGTRDPSVRLMAAELLVDLGLHREAALLCEEHLRLRGDSVEALSLLATARHEAGEFSMAVRAFEKALVLSPDNKELLNNLGYSLFCAGFLEPALSSFDRALAIDPGYKHAWYNKGYSLHGAERLSEAIECYEKAIVIDPGDRVLWNNLGNALYNLGLFEDSIPRFFEALRVDPDYEIAWNNIGNALEKMGRWEQAIPYHDRSLEIRPDFDYALYAKGICLSMTGRPEEGYDLILESLSLNPDYDEAWKARSQVARQLGRWDDALSSIEEALSVNPGFADGWADRGDILSATGDVAGAESSYRMALTQFPPLRNGSQGESAMVRRKAQVLMRLGRSDEAVGTLGEAVMARPRDHGMVSGFIRCLRMSTLCPVPDWLRAVMDGIDDPGILLDYCELMLDRGMHDEALKILERFPTSEETRERVLLMEALAYARAGIPEEEVSPLLAGLEYGPASRLRGELAEAKGDLAAAESEYSAALSAMPSDYTSAESLARVRLRLGDATGAVDAALTAWGIDPSEPGPPVLLQEARVASRAASASAPGKRREAKP